MFVLAGITWHPDQRKILEENFIPDLCQIELEFIFPADTEAKLSELLFPRKSTIMNFADFAILNRQTDKFELKTVSMTFDTVDLNWFVRPQSPLVKTNIKLVIFI